MNDTAPLKPYVVRFAIAYVMVTILLAVGAAAMKLDTRASLAVVSALAATFFAAAAFANDHGRGPTSQERSSFAWWALVMTWVVSLVFTAVILAVLLSREDLRGLLAMMRDRQILAIVAGTLLFVSVIEYVAIRWAFGWYARSAAARR